MVLPLALGLLLAAREPLGADWSDRKVGERHVFVPGYQRPPLIVGLSPASAEIRSGKELQLKLRFTVLAWLDHVSTSFDNADDARLWFLVNDGKETRVLRRSGVGLDCGVYVAPRSRPGRTFDVGVTLGQEDAARFFPRPGPYHLQAIYDQGHVTADSNWIAVKVAEP